MNSPHLPSGGIVVYQGYLFKTPPLDKFFIVSLDFSILASRVELIVYVLSIMNNVEINCSSGDYDLFSAVPVAVATRAGSNVVSSLAV